MPQVIIEGTKEELEKIGKVLCEQQELPFTEENAKKALATHLKRMYISWTRAHTPVTDLNLS